MVAASWRLGATFVFRNTEARKGTVAAMKRTRLLFVMTDCTGQLAALITMPNPGTGVSTRYFTYLDPNNLMSCTPMGGPFALGLSASVQNEYLVADVRRNWWVVTSNLPNRLHGTLTKIPTGGTPTSYAGMGGRYVMLDLPHYDDTGNPISQ